MSLRPKISSLALSLAVAVYILAVLNATFWTSTFNYLTAVPRVGIAFGVAYCALIVALCVVCSFRYLTKPALIFFILVSASCAYFADTFGVRVTAKIFGDLVATSTEEARGFLSWHLVLDIVIFGIVPSLLVIWVRVIYPSVSRRVTVVFASLALGAALVLANFSVLQIELKRDLLAASNPIGPIVAAADFARSKLRSHNIKIAPLGTDAKRDAAGRLPLVTIIVVGESARAQNFGLDGYARDTTPELRAAGVVNFPHATSCGTDTGTSVPCMFSAYGRRDYSGSKIRSTENLLDVLKHAGVPSIWWDNNDGSKGVADRVDYHAVSLDDVMNCIRGDCYDQVLVNSLLGSLDRVKEDTVIVLHQHGSHGPSYFERYPPAFRRFLPECRTAHLTDCSQEKITNAYDNSLLYTDHILGEVIQNLQEREDRIAPAMIYLSDHGESLGDDGLYMHGTAYFMAPSQQTHIPFVVWLGDSFSAATGIDAACVRAGADKPVSQDNVFHSVLGMMGISTSARDPALDLFGPCEGKRPGLPNLTELHSGKAPI